MTSADGAAVEHSGGEDGADCDSSDGAGDLEAPPSRNALAAHLTDCGGDADGRAGDGCGGSPDRMNRKMFECDVCNMKFSNGANMRRHKMRHTGVKPYECRICQKRFFRKDHLAEHVTIHTKTLPYHCPICARGFQRQIAMRAHFQNEHVGLHDVVKSCPLCSYQVPSLKGLRRHFLQRHGIDLDDPGQSMVVDKNGNATSVGNAISAQGNHLEDGDSSALACGEAATPPMHFLTPHIEISMADPSPSNPVMSTQTNGDEGTSPTTDVARVGNARSPLAGDSSKPRSSVALHRSPNGRENGSVVHMNGGAVSLITVKQEAQPEGSPADDDDDLNRLNQPGTATAAAAAAAVAAAVAAAAAAGGPVNLTTGRSGDALIKVSPLKSLLQDDSSRRNSTAHRPDTSSVPPLSAGRPVGTVSDSSYGTAWRNPKLQCIFCGITFPDHTLYFLHKGCHADYSPWRCNICGEQCGGVYDFNVHLLSKAHQ